MNDSMMITRTETMMSSNLGEETVMMDINSGKYFNLDTVGTAVWDMLDSPVAFGDIVSRLMQDFEVEEEVCRTEVKAFVEQMAELDMVHVG